MRLAPSRLRIKIAAALMSRTATRYIAQFYQRLGEDIQHRFLRLRVSRRGFLDCEPTQKIYYRPLMLTQVV
jgi:hypothetical protein